MAGLCTNKTKKYSSGQALVEFSLLFALFVFLVVAVVDIARLFQAEITITNAAREGARYATMKLKLQDGLSLAEQTVIRQRVHDEAVGSGIDIATGNVTVTCPLACAPNIPLTVTVTYDFDVLTTFWNTDHLVLRRQIEMLIP
jgi:Flp pilus assembly protein TadG